MPPTLNSQPSTTSDRFTVSVDQVTEREWNELLPLFDDASIYQTWAYGAVRWGEEQLSHLVLRQDQEIVAAAQVRVVQIPFLRKGIAYVRWGPLVRRKAYSTEVTIQRMTQALMQEYVRTRGLLLRVIPACYAGETLAEQIKTQWQEAGAAVDPTASYRTIRLSLGSELGTIRKGFGPKWRNKLNGSERNGLTIVKGTTDDFYKSFLSMYDEMMTRKGFGTTVDVLEFRAIQQRLPEEYKMQVFIAQRDGRDLNALVVTSLGDAAIYLLGATSDKGTELKGSYLLHWRAIQWLKDRGILWYDLGGINPENNVGVYEFKKGFGGQEVHQLPRLELSGSPLSTVCVGVGEVVRSILGSIRGKVRRRKLAVTAG